MASAGLPAAASWSQTLLWNFRKRDVRLRDDEVLVVAVIADEGEALGTSRQVVAVIAGHAAGRAR